MIITWLDDLTESSTTAELDFNGTFYSMRDFVTYLIPLIQFGVNVDPLLTTLSFDYD
jgi:hypothetical protein